MEMASYMTTIVYSETNGLILSDPDLVYTFMVYLTLSTPICSAFEYYLTVILVVHNHDIIAGVYEVLYSPCTFFLI